jgi:hypothetical protein
VTFDSACSLVESALADGVRREVVAAAAAALDARTAFSRVRDQMRSHRWVAGATHIALDALVGDYDARTRRDGLHVLNDWDGKADHVNPDPIAVDVATFLVDRSQSERPDPRALAVLVDYYFLYVLALLVVRVWDDGDADANFDRVGGLLERLQGPDGSGERFISDVETLLLIAGSHYERHEHGYDALLARVRGLSVARRRRIALTHAASLGSHLRFGIEATYNRDIGAMRDDNGVDYTWLCFSLATLLETWREARGAGDAIAAAGVAEAIANGLSADADAFLSARTTSVLAAHDAERRAVRDGVGADVSALSDTFAPSRPVTGVYSAIALFFNFSHNVLKGTVVDATLWGDPRELSLNDLLTGLPRDPATNRRKLRLLDTLMEFARTNPDRIHGRLMPVIVYDVVAGRRAFGALTRAVQGAFGRT